MDRLCKTNEQSPSLELPDISSVKIQIFNSITPSINHVINQFFHWQWTKKNKQLFRAIAFFRSRDFRITREKLRVSFLIILEYDNVINFKEILRAWNILRNCMEKN